MKKVYIFILAVFILSLSGCSGISEPKKYSVQSFESFDTVTTIVEWAENESEFQKDADTVISYLSELNRLFDIYNDYEGVNNLKTINDNAGISSVKVDSRIIELLSLCKDWYSRSKGRVNVAFGPVLSLWHDYREAGLQNPEKAELPPQNLLENGAKLSNIDDVIIDSAAGTVFLREPGMSLDVGAVAKGYAAELAGIAARDAGITSMLISIGGNIRAVGVPADGSDWKVGIQDPFNADEGKILYKVHIRDGKSVVSSGDYQRFYFVNGEKYSHIVDPDTLFPAQSFSGVTVICEDSGLADMLSTALFILPYEDGAALAEEFGADALWILPDGSVKMTPDVQRLYLPD